MSFLTAIRIILYFGLTAMLLSQPLTIVTVLCAVFTTAMVIVIAMIDYKSQVSEPINIHERAHREFGHLPNNSKRGMWCRMCGGECDLENCGMEQP